MEELEQVIQARVKELLKGKICNLPNADLYADSRFAQTNNLKKLINEAYARGWAEGETDLINDYQMLDMYAHDDKAYSELKQLAAKVPDSDMPLTREFLLYDRAVELVELTGGKPNMWWRSELLTLLKTAKGTKASAPKNAVSKKKPAPTKKAVSKKKA